MSEVQRYKVVKMLSEGGNRLTYSPHGPYIVMAEAFDAERQARLEAERQVGGLQTSKEAIESNLAKVDRVFLATNARLDTAMVLLSKAVRFMAPGSVRSELETFLNTTSTEGRVERGSTHRFEQSPNSCRHDDKSGVWRKEGSTTRTGQECNACGRVFEDPATGTEGKKAECSQCNGSQVETVPDGEGVWRDQKCT